MSKEISLSSNVGGEDSADVVPSIDDMIGAATDGAPTSGDTAMEELRIEFTGGDDDEDDKQTTSGEPAKRKYTRREPTADKPRAKKKAEVVAENEALQKKIAALEARTDVDKIKTLSATVSMASILGFGWTAQRRGPHWALSEQEAKELGETTAQALAPYVDVINEHAPAAMALMVWVKVFSDRIAIDKERVRQLNAGELR